MYFCRNFSASWTSVFWIHSSKPVMSSQTFCQSRSSSRCRTQSGSCTNTGRSVPHHFYVSSHVAGLQRFSCSFEYNFKEEITWFKIWKNDPSSSFTQDIQTDTPFHLIHLKVEVEKSKLMALLQECQTELTRENRHLSSTGSERLIKEHRVSSTERGVGLGETAPGFLPCLPPTLCVSSFIGFFQGEGPQVYLWEKAAADGGTLPEAPWGRRCPPDPGNSEEGLFRGSRGNQ